MPDYIQINHRIEETPVIIASKPLPDSLSSEEDACLYVTYILKNSC